VHQELDLLTQENILMNKPRTLVIGLDGATFDLIDPLVRAGHLPTLAKLMGEGVHGPLRAWPNMNSAAAWSSIVTGYNPGQHGIHYFGYPPQRYTTWGPTTGADRKKATFWQLLGAAGQRVGIVNVPISYPADRVNGFMLAGMDTPGVRSSGFAHPPDLYDELRGQGISYVIDDSALPAGPSRHSAQDLPQSVLRMVKARASTVLYLMNTRPWDALMAVFVAPDRVQHWFWPHDLSCVENQDWGPIKLLYQQIDSFLGDALQLVDENTTVLLISDHGFGAVRLAHHHLNALFAQLGLLRYRHGLKALKGGLLWKLLVLGRHVVPRRLRRPLRRAFPQVRRGALSERIYQGIDWSQTQVFAATPGLTIIVSLEGRWPGATVSPGEYDSVRERARDILLDLTDPTTGSRIIQAVDRSEELFHGPHMDQSPDLVLQWNDEAGSGGLCYREDDELVIVETALDRESGKTWKGTHYSEGIFVARGPHIKRGATIASATLYDIAPTILYMQDHPVLPDMDGEVLTDIFTADYLSQHPVRQGDAATADMQLSKASLDEQEAREIETRLTELGYID
jgi:predicted AlkP superfamily phosphohydrolase/phosphomutase